MVVSLGPSSLRASPSIPKNPLPNGQGLNRRCLRRDINRNSVLGATDKHALAVVNASSIDGFYNKLVATPPDRKDPFPWGVRVSSLFNFRPIYLSIHPPVYLSIPSLGSLCVDPRTDFGV